MLCEGVYTCNSFQHSDNILFGLYALQTPYLARQVFEVHNYCDRHLLQAILLVDW